MSFAILLIAIFVSAIFCEILDEVPDLLMAGLNPSRWLWGGCVLLLLAWLSGDSN